MKQFLAVFACMLISSCDYVYDYQYIVQNKSRSEIVVTLSATNFPQLDTIYFISTNQNILIYETGHGIEPAGGPFFDDVKNDLSEIVIKNIDSVMSNRNFRENSNWDFNGGTYSTTITDADF